MNPILDAPVITDQKLQYAGFWIRVVAYLIDTIVLGIGLSVLGFAFVGALMAGGSFGVIAVMYIVYIAVVAAYFSLMESSSKQATLGKMAVGIKVGDENGQRITTANALGRFFSKILSGLILYIGYIMVAFDIKKQGLHDKIASTVVYYG